jgi:uncharacterized protein YndB with AHSA1/START domain
MTMSASANAAPRRELTITRIVDAPRELVWQAWTEPKHLAQWFGPRGFTNPVCEVDLRVGGILRVVMRSPQGTDHAMKGIFREVEAPKRLAFTNNAYDVDGTQLLEGFTTVTFIEVGGKTRMILETSATGLADIAPQMLAGMEAGWTQSLEKLDELVARSAT